MKESLVRIIFAGAVVLSACRPAAPPARPVPDAALLTRQFEAQFQRSADAWNRGDLDAFVSDYAADTLPTFISRGHLQRGHDWIRANYAPLFEPGAQRDSLRFEQFHVRPLTADLALITARFILFRGDSVTASGPFTLLMQHQAQGWKILHDHSSSDPR